MQLLVQGWTNWLKEQNRESRYITTWLLNNGVRETGFPYWKVAGRKERKEDEKKAGREGEKKGEREKKKALSHIMHKNKV